VCKRYSDRVCITPGLSGCWHHSRQRPSCSCHPQPPVFPVFPGNHNSYCSKCNTVCPECQHHTSRASMCLLQGLHLGAVEHQLAGPVEDPGRPRCVGIRCQRLPGQAVQALLDSILHSQQPHLHSTCAQEREQQDAQDTAGQCCCLLCALSSAAGGCTLVATHILCRLIGAITWLLLCHPESY
jgi:hypothetical protein